MDRSLTQLLKQARADATMLGALTQQFLQCAWNEIKQGMDDDPDGDGDDAASPLARFDPIPGRIAYFPSRQIQKKYQKHATDFGFPKNYTPLNAQKFADLLGNFINNPSNQQMSGTYRGLPAIHYLNPETRMNVTTYLSGEFWTAFKLGHEQMNYWPDIKRGNHGA